METESYLRFILALVFVLGLIGILTILARRFGLGYATAKRGANRRLSLVEVMPLDPKTRLYLIRRDGIEHLIAAGPQGITNVETGIAAPLAAGGRQEPVLGSKPTTGPKGPTP